LKKNGNQLKTVNIRTLRGEPQNFRVRKQKKGC